MTARIKTKVRAPVDPYSNNRLSPLPKIRNAEAEIIREIAAAREAAERKIADAKMRAERLIRESRNAGYREGQAQLEATLFRAEEEAKAFKEQALNQAGKLRLEGGQRMEAAVRYAFKMIIGVDVEAERNEP